MAKLFQLFICSWSLLIAYSFQIHIDNEGASVDFNHFWKSTGLCPPDPKHEISKYLLSHEQKMHFALIGALPNHGIEFIRIHWLFFLIVFDQRSNSYDWNYLDKLMKFLKRHGLKPIFELMGRPIGERREWNKEYWRELVRRIAERYKSKFGLKEISSWKFELWNEPDLKNYNILNFTLPDYFSYVNGCVEGLKSAFRKEKQVGVTLGGPAGLFRERAQHPFCWSLLENCNRTSGCPLQFISFHRKGNGTAEGVLSETLKLLDLLQNEFANVVQMPIANDEADIMVTWSSSYEWLADVRYGAMVVKTISDFYQTVKLKRQLKIELLSNDNAFLNYHPFYFTQRTLFARFQMNHTAPPHSQFIKKPIYATMALLSYLEDEYLKLNSSLDYNNNNNDPLLTILPTRSSTNNNSSGSTTSILLAYGNNSMVNTENTRLVRVSLKNLSIGSKFVVYLLDNIVSNPYRVWLQLGGAPVFPNRQLRRQMRNVEEPQRIHGPNDVVNEKNFDISINLTMPSVALIHICSMPAHALGNVTNLTIFNVTRDEVLLTWSDNGINSKCIRTYEVEFEFKCENSLQFRRVNLNDTIFLSYHYVASGGATTSGRYRVRAVDYWGRPGNYSKIISFP